MFDGSLYRIEVEPRQTRRQDQPAAADDSNGLISATAFRALRGGASRAIMRPLCINKKKELGLLAVALRGYVRRSSEQSETAEPQPANVKRRVGDGNTARRGK